MAYQMPVNPGVIQRPQGTMGTSNNVMPQMPSVGTQPGMPQGMPTQQAPQNTMAGALANMPNMNQQFGGPGQNMPQAPQMQAPPSPQMPMLPQMQPPQMGAGAGMGQGMPQGPQGMMPQRPFQGGSWPMPQTPMGQSGWFGNNNNMMNNMQSRFGAQPNGMGGNRLFGMGGKFGA